MNIRILSAASEDLIRGKKFYEGQGEGLGTYFVDTLFSDIESLLLYAGIHKRILEYHCMFSRRFPYAIYYKGESGEIRVYRVLDCRQDPQKTSKALN